MKPLNSTLTNSEVSDEMPHSVEFYQGLHCLLYYDKKSSEKEIQFYSEIISCDFSIYIIDQPDLFVCLLCLI